MSKALDSAARGAKWLLNLLRRDGSFAGDPPLTAYYKAPYALLASGYPVHAERVLDYIKQRFLGSDGDLDGTGVAWFQQFRTYPHSWIACGAICRGRLDIAEPLVQFLIRRQDVATGGFAADDSGMQEIMTGSMAGLACLWSGKEKNALALAGWLQTVYLAQPDLAKGLYHAWMPGHGLITEFDPEKATSFLVDATRPRQWYFQYGISAAFLSQLAGVTGDEGWIDLARKYLAASRLCGDNAYSTPQSGKIGWGSAWTFRLTQKLEDAAYIEPVIDTLCRLQTSDGSWHPGSVYEPATEENTEPRLDITAEFVALQSEMGIISGV